jgi:cell division protein FtsZ
MAPTLVESQPEPVMTSLKPLPEAVQEQADSMSYGSGVVRTVEQPERKTETADAGAFTLTIKEEEPQPSGMSFKIGEHVLSADEMEEKRRFEEQKRALEERAERLRRLSFNIKGGDSGDDLENVPAYMRRNVELPNNGSSSDNSYLSGYSVGVNEGQQGKQASIQTINTFLDGKKPD